MKGTPQREQRLAVTEKKRQQGQMRLSECEIRKKDKTRRQGENFLCFETFLLVLVGGKKEKEMVNMYGRMCWFEEADR